jgi:hypothetical protein
VAGSIIGYKKMKKIFKSRISILLSLIVWPLVLMPFIFFVKQVFINHNSDCIPPLIVFTIIIPFFFLIWFGIRYIIDGNKIVFKTGFFKNGEIEISKIISIKRSYLVLSSNAVSLKRLKCDLKKGSKYPFLLISPDKEDLFLQMIKGINPSVEIDIQDKSTLLNWDF